MAHQISTDGKYHAVDHLTIADIDNARLEAAIRGDVLVVWTVDPQGDGGPMVAVCGEDLFALREVLAELPESAFTRPADPVDTSWTDGDYVYHTCGNRYVRKDSLWHAVGTTATFPDSMINQCLEASVAPGQGMRIAYKQGPVPAKFEGLVL